MTVKFSRQILEKYLNIKFKRKSVQWEPSCFMRRAYGQPDRQHETSSSSSQFFERTYKPAIQSADNIIKFKAGLSPIHFNCTAASLFCLVSDIINEACGVNSSFCRLSKINIS